MGAVTILVAKPATKQTMGFVTADGFRGSMYTTPEGFEYKHLPEFGQVQREGKQAITRVVSPGLRTLKFSHTIASLDYQRSIQAVMQRFTNTAARGTRVRFTGGSGPFEQPCWWFIKDLSSSVVSRALNNEPSWVEVSWDLEEAVDVTANIIGPKSSAKKSVSKTPPRKVASPVRTYKVAPGDTLWAIAAKFLKAGERWPEIVAANRSVISNPNQIQAGQVVRIPG